MRQKSELISQVKLREACLLVTPERSEGSPGSWLLLNVVKDLLVPCCCLLIIDQCLLLTVYCLGTRTK